MRISSCTSSGELSSSRIYTVSSYIASRKKADCDSNRILSSAQTIDRSLVETKGREFVERMRASLPKLPGEDNEGVAEIGRIVSPSGATGEAVIRICQCPINYNLTARLLGKVEPLDCTLHCKTLIMADEEWVTKARFQYSDLSYTSEGKQAYHHAFSSGITAIEGQASLHYCTEAVPAN